MIAKIKGTLTETDGSEGLIETVTGVTYRVFLTGKTLSLLVPHPVEIYTYHQIREDAQVLFGFETKQEYQFYCLLLTVDGVGPKTAFTVISQLPPQAIYDAVRANDVASFTKVSGLGKKTAQKIILELSSKFKTGFDFAKVKETELDEEAIIALQSLGYTKKDAVEMLKHVDMSLSLQEKIREALKKK